MTKTLSRAAQLRNDLDTLYFAHRQYTMDLAELEQLGRTHTAEFKVAEENVRILNHNIKRLEAELEAEEERELDAETDGRYFGLGFNW